MPENMETKTEIVKKDREAFSSTNTLTSGWPLYLGEAAYGVFSKLGEPETVLQRNGLPLLRKNRICALSYVMIHNPNMLKTKEQHGAGTWREQKARGARDAEIGI